MNDIGITLTADYIPSILNKDADFEWRNSTAGAIGNWKNSFSERFAHVKIWGNPDIDLFASRTSNQPETYFSWRPDPDCLTMYLKGTNSVSEIADKF